MGWGAAGLRWRRSRPLFLRRLETLPGIQGWHLDHVPSWGLPRFRVSCCDHHLFPDLPGGLAEAALPPFLTGDGGKAVTLLSLRFCTCRVRDSFTDLFKI